ncbi:histidine kinase dimerization/phospho-acceptor domain-containing protein [Alteromonas sp. ASW11-130]|uniref:histidine kinase dimerization/phospho-acceptor domain-containing protein n=1 Tax=Alteromonas sp. ASW11-130 TaxID=3015775 RepID=UPI0022429EBF|nr:histidine kinase dimerization/phospho-acceptor domain-containing protein [Alteromonas sp. ASW11-130]MCW8092713.1 ATP-binding protein [Alteromonas sp. ASW11-130]
MMSLRVKLLSIIAPVFTLLWLIASYFSITQLKDEINQTMDNRLLATARMVNNLVLSSEQPNTTFGLKAGTPFNDSGSTKGLACKISSLNGEIIANSHPDELKLTSLLPSGFDSVVIDETRWRVYTLNTQFHAISIAERLSERHSIFIEIVLVNALPTLVAILVSFIIIWFALGRELRPLQLLRKAVSDRSPHDLKPIQLKHKLVELTPLIDSQNTLFKKLESVIEREKSFTDNAAHELRTPLTGIISQLQVAKVTDGEVRENAIKQSLYSAIRLQSLVENLLLLARIDHKYASQNIESWNVNNELTNVLQELGVGSDKIDVHVDTKQKINHIPAFAFNIIIKNLVENALQHGETDSSISLDIQEKTHGFFIKVSNYATVSDDTLEKMTQRFWRACSARGTGLGLAIVKALVDALDGTIDISYENKNVLSVCILFPVDKTPSPSM